MMTAHRLRSYRTSYEFLRHFLLCKILLRGRVRKKESCPISIISITVLNHLFYSEVRKFACSNLFLICIVVYNDGDRGITSIYMAG